MDGEQGFFEALNYVPYRSKPDIFRLDHEICGPVPKLDDIGSLDAFSGMSFSVPDDLVRVILASAMFFFELDEIPVKNHAGYFCRGSILCARPGAAAILQRVLAEFPCARFQAGPSCDLGHVDPLDCCPSCGYFRKCVTFPLVSLDERISIQIANSVSCERIGGFPSSMRELLEHQQAVTPFGRVDHRVLDWPSRRQCPCSRKKKRSVHFSEPMPPKKPRR